MKSILNREYFQSTQSYLLVAFATFPIHMNYWHPNIEYMPIIYFYRNLLCICYEPLHIDK